MSPRSARSVHLAFLAVAGTGLVYAWMAWLVEPADEFAIVNHPWQPDLQYWHILSAPLLVFAVGAIWSAHVWASFRNRARPRRRTGIALMLLFAPMCMSGYALQVAQDEAWRSAWVWTHGVTSIVWTLGYLLHQLAPRRKPGSATRR